MHVSKSVPIFIIFSNLYNIMLRYFFKHLKSKISLFIIFPNLILFWYSVESWDPEVNNFQTRLFSSLICGAQKETPSGTLYPSQTKSEQESSWKHLREQLHAPCVIYISACSSWRWKWKKMLWFMGVRKLEWRKASYRSQKKVICIRRSIYIHTRRNKFPTLAHTISNWSTS